MPKTQTEKIINFLEREMQKRLAIKQMWNINATALDDDSVIAEAVMDGNADSFMSSKGIYGRFG